MKKNDYLLIAVVIFVSGIFSYVLSGIVISSPKNRTEQVEKVEPISSSFNYPDNKFFNKDSLNSTKIITIGENTNITPLKETTSQ